MRTRPGGPRTRGVSRRGVLRGSGVALALPWLESLAPRRAEAQLALTPKRFLPIALPNGSADQWWASMPAGTGASFTLSPVLEPFAPIKEHVTVLSNVGNSSPFSDTDPVVSPEHARSMGALLTCMNADALNQGLPNDQQTANGISMDQVIAQSGTPLGTPLPSLQLSLATALSSCDGRHCAYSQSISWAGSQQPLAPIIDPREAFDAIAGVSPGPSVVAPELRKQLNLSILDSVNESAQRASQQLGAADKERFDRFLTSVRSIEERVAASRPADPPAACGAGERPTMAASHVTANQGAPGDPDYYDKGAHADLMNDLIAMAFGCNVTEVISYMLEDARSDFVHDTLALRQFSETGSVEGTGFCGNHHASMHGPSDNDDYATITWWYCLKVSELCQRLSAMEDGPGVSVLDNSLVMLVSPLHGASHYFTDLPLALVGSGGGTFKTDHHVAFDPFPDDRALSDLYFTILNEYYGLNVPSFGSRVDGAPNASITEILA